MNSLIKILPFLILTTQLFAQKQDCDPPIITRIFPTSPCLYAGDSMYFGSITTGANNFIWNFGNGDVSTDENPIEVFTNYGYHCITLTATNSCGSSTHSEVIFVNPDACPCNTFYYDFPDGSFLTTDLDNVTVSI